MSARRVGVNRPLLPETELLIVEVGVTASRSVAGAPQAVLSRPPPYLGSPAAAQQALSPVCVSFLCHFLLPCPPVLLPLPRSAFHLFPRSAFPHLLPPPPCYTVRSRGGSVTAMVGDGCSPAGIGHAIAGWCGQRAAPAVIRVAGVGGVRAHHTHRQLQPRRRQQDSAGGAGDGHSWNDLVVCNVEQESTAAQSLERGCSAATPTGASAGGMLTSEPFRAPPADRRCFCWGACCAGTCFACSRLSRSWCSR